MMCPLQEGELPHTLPNHQYATASQLLFPSVLAINSAINWSVCLPTPVAKIYPGSGWLSHPSPTIT
ncbi:MAG: hypothetical protein F6K23_27320 [Okeania sp. SIO2C9]|uniref:hypothetical protein n=1 Tax=Okeania sp. SIO2C9 TaxID=2607791 RepID=UPI0013C1A12C|nr:hypothetical protein [Okeania sp. SIO2C9]NEQ76423.1 hypothetical protein [Okeania sp. SIO2C9]